MPGAQEFCIRTPHLEGEEIFLSMKRKADLPPGSELDFHRPDKISISCARVQTRSSIKNSQTASPTVDSESPETFATPIAPQQSNCKTRVSDVTPLAPLQHVTTVQESVCDESNWHIARLPKTSTKACFAIQAMTNKKCMARIVQDMKSTVAPTYTGMMTNYRKNKQKLLQFFFCNDNIERCVKGTRRKWIISRPEVPKTWACQDGDKTYPQGDLPIGDCWISPSSTTRNLSKTIVPRQPLSRGLDFVCYSGISRWVHQAYVREEYPSHE
jgi:hypothetical protein